MNIDNFLEIAQGKRTLQKRTGEPFFWLGDTAWAAPARSTWDEWKKYVDIRARQGFNVIQVNSLPQYDAAKPVWEERKPFAMDSGEQWNYDEIQKGYFDYLDKMIEYANNNGLVVAVVVLWFVHVPNARMELKSAAHCTSRMTLEQAQQYAEFLVKRLEGRNVVWVISGDDVYDGEGVVEFYDAVGETVQRADADKRPITTHPAYMSGEFFHNSQWLDFNMVQSSHGDTLQHQAYEFVTKEWVKQPPKPVINAEPCYEGCKGWNTGKIFDRRDVRKACWWSILSGSIAGITYGGHGIWQWRKTEEVDCSSDAMKHMPWYEAVLLPGSQDVVRIKAFLTGFSWWTLGPSQHRLLSKHESYIPVAASKDGKLLMAYLPEGGEIKLDITGISRKATAYWWNPSNGEKHSIEIPEENNIILNAPSGLDWIFAMGIEDS